MDALLTIVDIDAMLFVDDPRTLFNLHVVHRGIG